ncbi:MAG: PIN domain-containing protein [Gemmataceae bacterium]
MAQSSAVFLDTSGWIAFLNKDDEWHEKALLLMEDIHQSGRTLVTTDSVLAETGNGLARTPARKLFVASVRSFQSSLGCRIETVGPTLLEDALSLYEAAHDKTWGLIDCASFVLMKREGMQDAFTADRHFPAGGVQCASRVRLM